MDIKIYTSATLGKQGSLTSTFGPPQDVPDSTVGKDSACNVGDLGLIPGLGRSPGVRKGYPLQYSGLENSMDFIVHGVTNHRTRLSNFHFQLFRPSNLLPSPKSKYFSQSYNRALKCDSVIW